MNKTTATPFLAPYQCDFIRPKHIIGVLCKYRVKMAQKGAKKQLLRELTNNKEELGRLKFSNSFFEELRQLLPPRRQWKRPLSKERESNKDSIYIAQSSILNRIKTTHKQVRDGFIIPPTWYVNLCDLIDQINARLKKIDSFAFESPTTIPVRKERGSIICRPITIYNLQDRIIQSLTARYLIQAFDPLFKDDVCLAFRHVKYVDQKPLVIKHHRALELMKNFHRTSVAEKRKIWVAECDINKFFDCINHRVVSSLFDKYVSYFEKCNSAINPFAIKLFKSYLDSFSFVHNVLPLNKKKGFFERHGIQEGYFDYPLTRLKKFYPRDGKLIRRIGVPQGGAISCFIANLIMHEVDVEVLKHSHAQFLYLRYCDDMILFDCNKKRCERILRAYVSSVKKLKLLVHPPITTHSYSDKQYRKDFWGQKSKLPFLWGLPTKNNMAIPWIAFVGYQVKYNGAVRIRRKSLKKENDKQKLLLKETFKVIRAHDKISLDDNSRKAAIQQRLILQNRLIAMSVGKVSLHKDSNTKHYCWTNGFIELTPNQSSKKQLKDLDRSRRVTISILKRKLNEMKKESQDVKSLNKKRKSIRFYGKPFSYYAFLEKLKSE